MGFVCVFVCVLLCSVTVCTDGCARPSSWGFCGGSRSRQLLNMKIKKGDIEEKRRDVEGMDEGEQQEDNKMGGEKWVVAAAGSSLWHLRGNSF